MFRSLALASLLLVLASSPATAQAPAAADTQARPEKPAAERSVDLLLRSYSVVEPGRTNLPPLTVAQKFRLSLHYFDPPTYFFTAFSSGIEQATNAKAGFGQGAAGYGKRYGANFADGLTGELLSTAILPSLLHTDPRYFRKGEGGGDARIAYALSRVFITRTDSGRNILNFPGILGAAGSSAISNVYYPDGEGGADDMAVRFGFQMAIGAGFNVLKEFTPELKRKFFRRGRHTATVVKTP